MSLVQSIIARAFAATTHVETVACGPFSIQLSLDDWAHDQGVLPSFAGAVPADDHPVDFKAAIVGGRSLPAALEPADPAKITIRETEDFYVLWSPLPDGVLYIYDFASRMSVMWCIQATMPAWLLSRPILPLIHAHASRTEWVPVHSAAVGRNGNFLLLVGPSKAGKSTASLACAAAGWDYAGDDFVLVGSAQRRVEPIYMTGRPRVSQFSNLPHNLMDTVYGESNNDNDPRLELRLNRGSSKINVCGGSIQRVLIPRRRNDPPFQPIRARAAEAFTSMAASTSINLPGLAAPLTRKILVTAGAIPAYFIDTGNDPMAIPAGLQRILESEIAPMQGAKRDL